MRILLAILLAITANAATITVCSSGCTYTTVQAAITAASRGDFIDITAGQTFEEKVTLPIKTGSGVVTVRSSRWAELPPTGTRVTSAHTALMPQLQPPTTTDPVLTTGEYLLGVVSANTSTNRLTFDNPVTWTAGQPISCDAYNNDNPIVLPSPIAVNTIYYVLNPSGSTTQLSATPGGSVIPITTSTITATGFNCSLALAVSGYRFQGINFSKKSNQTTEYNLIEIGTSVASSRAGIPYDISIDHSWIHGLYQENGPRICLYLNSGTFSLTDSTIENCNKEGGDEGKAIAGTQAVGPITIRNNYISAGSINVLFGGGSTRIIGLVNGDQGPIQFIGNHVTRPFWVKYSSGTGTVGAPVGACTNGTFNLNISNGVMYYCSSSAWGLAPTPADGEYFRRTDVATNCGAGACWQAASGVFVASTYYRGSSYSTKNLFEMKNVANMTTSGNVFENNWNNSDQAGYAAWPCSLVEQGDASGTATCRDSIFSLNIIRQSTNGIRMSRTGNPIVTQPLSRYTIQNNLLYKISNTDYPSIDTVTSQLNYFGGICNDCLFNHNTSNTGTNTAAGAGIEYDTNAMNRWNYINSISMAQLYGLFYDGSVACTVFLPSPSQTINTVLLHSSTSAITGCATNTKYLNIATTMFTSSTNFRLQPTSPYSASCVSGCDFTATDGKDLGADIDIIDASTQGVVTGTPWLGNSVSVTAGSTRAIVRYTAPDSASCTLKLYNDIGRASLNADTDTVGEQADTRTGNITAGLSRQFVLGTNSALTASTQYWAIINCGTYVGYTPVRTVATGAGFNQITTYSSANTGEYSSSADMSSPTAISSSTSHTVPIPSNSVRYYRATGGLISALVSP